MHTQSTSNCNFKLQIVTNMDLKLFKRLPNWVISNRLPSDWRLRLWPAHSRGRRVPLKGSNNESFYLTYRPKAHLTSSMRTYALSKDAVYLFTGCHKTMLTIMRRKTMVRGTRMFWSTWLNILGSAGLRLSLTCFTPTKNILIYIKTTPIF